MFNEYLLFGVNSRFRTSIQVGSRLHHANVDYETKRPVTLDRYQKIVHMCVCSLGTIRLTHFHINLELTMSLLR